MNARIMKMTSEKKLEKTSNRLRIAALHMVHTAQSGHVGGSLSIMDILVALYHGGICRHRAKAPAWPSRDRLFLSKGHATPALYAVLADRGFFSPSLLSGFRRISSSLQGHVQKKVPGCEASGGSLGQGLSLGVGAALSLQLQKKKSHVWVLLGDGELQEGQNWEAMMTASKYALQNITAIVDVNRLQIDGWTDDIMPLKNLAEKWKSFGWQVLEVDGHSMKQLLKVLARARARTTKKPCVVLAKTIKGKGAPAAENVCAFHGKPLSHTQLKEAEDALMRA